MKQRPVPLFALSLLSLMDQGTTLLREWEGDGYFLWVRYAGGRKDKGPKRLFEMFDALRNQRLIAETGREGDSEVWAVTDAGKALLERVKATGSQF